MTDTRSPESAGFVVLFRWGWVTLPLAWGVWRTIETSKALFQ